MLPHLAGQMRQQLVLVIQLYSKHRAGQDRGNGPLDLNRFFITHARLKYLLEISLPRAGSTMRPVVNY